MNKISSRSGFVILFAINFLVTFSFAVNDSMFSLFCEDNYISGFIFGFVFAVYSLTKIISAPFAGKLADRFGTHKILFTALVLYTLVPCFFLITDDKAVIITVRILQGLACAMFRPVIYCFFPADSARKGRIFALFDLSFYSAIALAPYSGSLILESYGFRGVFTSMLACCVAALAIFPALIQEKPAYKNMPKTQIQKNSGSAINPLLVYIFFRGWGISVITAFLPIYLSRMDIPPSKIGFTLSAAAAFTTISLPLCGRLTDIIHKETLIAAGGFCVSFTTIFTVFFSGFGSIFLLMSLGGIFTAMSQPACLSFITEKTDECSRGHSMGKFNAFMGMGFACGPAFGAMLSSAAGLKAVFIMTGFLGIVSVFVFMYGTQVYPGTTGTSGFKKTF
jgi:MFS family permease